MGRSARTKNIVVGTDGSATAAEAVRRAVELAAAQGASLHVVTAYRPKGAGGAGRRRREGPGAGGLRRRGQPGRGGRRRGRRGRQRGAGGGARRGGRGGPQEALPPQQPLGGHQWEGRGCELP